VGDARGLGFSDVSAADMRWAGEVFVAA